MPHLKLPKIYTFIISVILAAALSLVLSLVFKKMVRELAFFKDKKNIEYLAAENIKLQTKILELKNTILDRKDLIEENKELKKMLSLEDKYAPLFLACSIINKSPWQWEKKIFLDKGKNQGVRSGDLVVDFKAHLVGKVEKLQDNGCWVRLISDPNFKISVNCQELNTIMVGAFFQGAKLLYVASDSNLSLGDRVSLAGIIKDGPKILVGELSYIDKNYDALTQNIFVRPYADLDNLHRVFIIKSK